MLLNSIVRKILFVPLALILLFEEWGWEPLAALVAKLARLPIWSSLEKKITQLGPYASLLVFGVPMLCLLPVKIFALYLFSQNMTTQGVILLISAKLFGTAVAARLFQLTNPALMQLTWFARWYPRWLTWKNNLLAQVRATSLWRVLRKLKLEIKSWWVNLRQ